MSTSDPTMASDQNNFRYPVFDAEIEVSIALTGTAASLIPATSTLIYLCANEGFFYSDTETATNVAGGRSHFVGAGVQYPVKVAIGDVISVISNGISGVLTYSTMT